MDSAEPEVSAAAVTSAAVASAAAAAAIDAAAVVVVVAVAVLVSVATGVVADAGDDNDDDDDDCLGKVEVVAFRSLPADDEEACPPAPCPQLLASHCPSMNPTLFALSVYASDLIMVKGSSCPVRIWFKSCEWRTLRGVEG